jgi:hypothetical protein
VLAFGFVEGGSAMLHKDFLDRVDVGFAWGLIESFATQPREAPEDANRGAELIAERWQISRTECDDIALRQDDRVGNPQIHHAVGFHPHDELKMLFCDLLVIDRHIL